MVKKGGWVLIGCFIATIGLAVFQYTETDKENKRKERQVILDQDRRDSISNQKNQDNTNKVVNTFTEALAKYGLKYDTVKQEIQKLIKDSLNRNTTIIEANEPVIKLCKQEPIKYEGFKDDKHHFAINICDYEAAGRNVEAKLYVYVSNHNYENLQLILTDQILKINDMPTNEQRRSQYNFWTTVSDPNFIFHLRGTYTNSIGKRKYQIDEMYGFEMNPFNNGYLHERTKQKVLSQIKF